MFRSVPGERFNYYQMSEWDVALFKSLTDTTEILLMDMLQYMLKKYQPFYLRSFRYLPGVSRLR